MGRANPLLIESSIEKEVMASNVIGNINLFISILFFKYNTCSRKNFHQTILKKQSEYCAHDTHDNHQSNQPRRGVAEAEAPRRGRGNRGRWIF